MKSNPLMKTIRSLVKRLADWQVSFEFPVTGRGFLLAKKETCDIIQELEKALKGNVVVSQKDLEKLNEGSNFSRAVETQKFLDKYL